MFGVFDIALGWAWHTAYRARKFWRWKREGALVAAAAVTIIASVDVGHRLMLEAEGPVMSRAAASSDQTAQPASTAAATPTAEASAVIETISTVDLPPEPIRTVAAAQSPALADDPIGAVIESGKLYTDPISTGSITPARPEKLSQKQ
ncbi:MAG: hypothetical protein ACK50Q_00845 [Labrys sp. (in: a-proteobacteria)]|jgi:hypothetical protein